MKNSTRALLSCILIIGLNVMIGRWLSIPYQAITFLQIIVNFYYLMLYLCTIDPKKKFTTFQETGKLMLLNIKNQWKNLLVCLISILAFFLPPFKPINVYLGCNFFFICFQTFHILSINSLEPQQKNKPS
ncbi:hypothetical protein A9Y57_00598 [Streptococcus parauberis]|uniref:Uncharacterized protein n=1 Tax=Streptococcus parauberis TaxID=1348 RepID=A0A854W9J0_9STRE|nr:hypothetical protein A9Y57_00598 [Streptococcus parauberis]